MGIKKGMRYGDVFWKERQLSLSESEAGWFRMGNGKTGQYLNVKRKVVEGS